MFEFVMKFLAKSLRLRSGRQNRVTNRMNHSVRLSGDEV